MPHESYLQIADINFSVRCRQSTILQNDNKNYRGFLKEVARPSGDLTVDVVLDLGQMPDTGAMKKVFDSEQSWSMYSDGKDRFLSLAAQDGTSRWIAHFGSISSGVTVHCSDLQKSREGGKTAVLNPVNYPLDQLLLIYALSQMQGTIVHAAGAGINDECFIFAGKSGTGKSTIARLLSAGKHTEMLSDDRIVLRNIEGKLYAFGTPWPGDAHMAENRKYPLRGIFFIHHGSENRVVKLSQRETVERLLPITSVLWYDKALVEAALCFCEDIALRIPSYELYFRPDSELRNFIERFEPRERHGKSRRDI
jgi:hypothetical protein